MDDKINDDELNTIKLWAERKRAILNDIYDITVHNEFKGERSEIDGFVEYLELRKPYYKELTELNEESNGVLGTFVLNFGSSNGLYREVSQILLDATDVATKISELDKVNNMNMQRVTEDLRKEVKYIKASKKARNSYNFFQVQNGATEL